MMFLFKHYYVLHVYVHVGVEKNNDDSKRHYFSSNKMEATAKILSCDYRLEVMRQGVWRHFSCHREKRRYTQRDEEYWNNGGIQEARERKALHPFLFYGVLTDIKPERKDIIFFFVVHQNKR